MGETSPDSVFANIMSDDRTNNNKYHHQPFLNLPNQRSTSAPLERQYHHKIDEEGDSSYPPSSSSLWGTSNYSGAASRANSDILDQVTQNYGEMSIGGSSTTNNARLHRSSSAFGRTSDETNYSFFAAHEERGATAPPSATLWNTQQPPQNTWDRPPARPAAKTLMELIQEQDTIQHAATAQQQQQQQRLMNPPGYPPYPEQRWVLETNTRPTMYQQQLRPQQVLLGNPSGDFRVLPATAAYAPSTASYVQPPYSTNLTPPSSLSPPPAQQYHRRGPQPRRRPSHPRNHRDMSSSSLYPPSPSKQQTPNSLLEEFRNSKRSDWTIRRIVGHIVEFCQDQNGSRFIQQRLELGDSVDLVLNEVLPSIHILRIDVFGNYVVQKLLDFGGADMRSEIRHTLEGEMVSLSLQMYGCRVVQKALETLSEDELPVLLREFHHNVLSLIHDQNGNHVIQKCVEVLNARASAALRHGDAHRAEYLWDQVDFIVQDVLVNTKSLSCHPYGCRVFQRMLEHCCERRKLELLDIIQESHETLLDDQYGNYVIQHVLQYGRDEDRNSILGIIQKHGLLGLSRQKFASNVVEKLLKYGNSHHRRAVIREMLKKTEDPALHAAAKHVSIVLLMVRDAYANYVVQTTLDVAPESPERRALLYELNSHVDELRNYTFAKHIVAKLTSSSSSGR